MADQKKLKALQEALEVANHSLQNARNIIGELTGNSSPKSNGDAVQSTASKRDFSITENETEKVIEGVFDGEKMLGPDGRAYPVPHNYASKSKLVPGDLLKLSIADDGRFIYKNIGPIDRKTTIGTLTYEDGAYKVLAEGKQYKILTASVTFFKAEPGDQLAIIIPAKHDSSWAAVEALITQPTDASDIVAAASVDTKAETPDEEIPEGQAAIETEPEPEIEAKPKKKTAPKKEEEPNGSYEAEE